MKLNKWTIIAISLVCVDFACQKRPAMKFLKSPEMIFIEIPFGYLNVRHNSNESGRIAIDPFWISQTEITKEQWQIIMNTRPWPGDNQECDPKTPATTISWYDATNFCMVLSKRNGIRYRLPTELEWQYACVSGNFSDLYRIYIQDELDACSWYSNNSNNMLHKVGQKKPNLFMLYDMLGNVSEWCENHPFLAATIKNIEFPPLCSLNDPVTGMARTEIKPIMGGSFWSTIEKCQPYYRNSTSANLRRPDVGFRIVFNVK